MVHLFYYLLGFSCWPRATQRQHCEDFVRFVGLAFLIALIITALAFATVFRDMPHGESVFSSVVGCVVVVIVTILPDACHEVNKCSVRLMCVGLSVFTAVLVAVVSYYVHNSSGIDVGISIGVGGVAAGAQWLLQLLLCTPKYRDNFRAQIEAVPCGCLRGCLLSCCCCDPPAITTDESSSALLQTEFANSDQELARMV